MPFADVNDHRIYYEVNGDGPRTVILSHGFVMDHPWIAVVQGAGHCPTLTHPDETTAALRRFLQTL